MNAFHLLADLLEPLRLSGKLAWLSTAGLVAIAIITQIGVSYALKHEIPSILRGILEGLSNRDLPSRKKIENT